MKHRKQVEAFRRMRNWIRQRNWCIRRAKAWCQWPGYIPDISPAAWQGILLRLSQGKEG